MNRIIDDMIEKIELFDRKLYILEDLVNDLRLNYNIKKDIENVKKKKNIKTQKKIKKREPFNNYVIDTSDSESSSDSD
tara:strand:+ start:119 stop:352 length:234 start_codon:yes stop_codon:yes gene_type:complete